MPKAILTEYCTKTGLTIYDIDPQGPELRLLAGPDGADLDTLAERWNKYDGDIRRDVPGEREDVAMEAFRPVTKEEFVLIVNGHKDEIPKRYHYEVEINLEDRPDVSTTEYIASTTDEEAARYAEKLCWDFCKANDVEDVQEVRYRVMKDVHEDIVTLDMRGEGYVNPAYLIDGPCYEFDRYLADHCIYTAEDFTYYCWDQPVPHRDYWRQEVDRLNAYLRKLDDVREKSST